jgi:TrmH RNA methyltransferase
MNGWQDGLGGDDEFHDDKDDNIGNRADGPPTHDGPRPPRFEGEGQPRRARLGLKTGAQRRERGPRGPQGQGGGFGNRDPQHGQGRSEGNPSGNGNGNGGGNPQHQGSGAPRHERGPRRGRGGRGRGGRDQERGGRLRQDEHQQAPRPETEGGDRRPRGGLREDECKVYGINACLAVFQHRPEALIRAYVTNETLRRFGYAMKFLAEQRRAYHVVSREELDRVTESEHHGGVCFVIRKRVPLTVPEFVERLGAQPKARVVMLEGVANPHNLGALLRSCAHFGVDAVLVEDGGAVQGGAAARVAEGAAESVQLVQYQGAGGALAALHQAGFARVVTSSHAPNSVYAAELPEKAVYVLGSEGHGASLEAAESADLALAIPGTGAVESLNVSVAAGVLLGELFRRHGPAGAILAPAEPVDPAHAAGPHDATEGEAPRAEAFRAPR